MDYSSMPEWFESASHVLSWVALGSVVTSLVFTSKVLESRFREIRELIIGLDICIRTVIGYSSLTGLHHIRVQIDKETDSPAAVTCRNLAVSGITKSMETVVAHTPSSGGEEESTGLHLETVGFEMDERTIYPSTFKESKSVSQCPGCMQTSTDKTPHGCLLDRPIVMTGKSLRVGMNRIIPKTAAMTALNSATVDK